MLLERQHPLLIEHHVEVVEIAGQPAHLHVIALPDDHHVVPIADECRHRPMGHVHERTRRLHDVQAERPSAGEGPRRRTVRGDHQGGRRHLRDIVGNGDAPGRERAEDGRVVDQVTEDGERAGFGAGERQRDRVAHAEAHAQMRRSDDSHGSSILVLVALTQITLCRKVSPAVLRFSWLDFKLGLRMLARYPGLTLVGTVAIAVAIALGSAYFEAVDKFLNPRLPFPDADRVVSLRNWDVNEFEPEARSLHDFAIWRAQLETVENVGAAIAFVRNLATEDGRVEPVRGAEMTANAFRLMGTPPLLGRTLMERDERPAEPPVVVLGHALWKTRFESDPGVLGRMVKLGTATATIVGVMPEAFAFPSKPPPLDAAPRGRGHARAANGPAVSIFGRLAPGASIDEARTELGVIGARMSASSPRTHEHLRPRVTGYAKPHRRRRRGPVFQATALPRERRFPAAARHHLHERRDARVCPDGDTQLGDHRPQRARREPRPHHQPAVHRGAGTDRRRDDRRPPRREVALRRALSRWRQWLPFWLDDSLSWRTILYAAVLTLFGAAMVGILPALRIRVNIQDMLRSQSAGRAGLRFGGFWTAVIIVQVAITVAFIPLAAGGVFESNRFNERAEAIGAERFLAAHAAIDRDDLGVDSATYAARVRSSFDALEAG